LFALLVAGAVAATLLFPRSFATLPNISAILRNLALDAIMAAGMMLLLIAGDFDLSIGAIFSLSGVLAGWLLKTMGAPVCLAIPAALSAGGLCGAINGLIVTRVRVNALIATLGTMQVFRGIAVLIGGPGISFLPPSFSRLGQAEWLGLQTPVWLMLAVTAAGQYLLSRTRYFRQFYYIGANRRAAALCGFRVERLRLLAFGIMGFLAGLAGIAFAARLGTSVSIAGDGAELRIITATILGGASLTGGKGAVWGSLVGVAFIALINNMMILGQVSSYWQSIITGTVLVLAVAADRIFHREA
jgi:ribose transport system permease protein